MKKLLFIALSLVAVGCSQYGGYRPVTDSYNDRYSDYRDRDYAECRNFAEEASGGAVKQGAIGAGVGGLGGAAAGAALGAILGNPGKGAALGAAVGGLGGAGKQSYESDQRYRYAFQNCMANRNHSVIR